MTLEKGEQKAHKRKNHPSKKETGVVQVKPQKSNDRYYWDLLVRNNFPLDAILEKLAIDDTNEKTSHTKNVDAAIRNNQKEAESTAILKNISSEFSTIDNYRNEFESMALELRDHSINREKSISKIDEARYEIEELRKKIQFILNDVASNTTQQQRIVYELKEISEELDPRPRRKPINESIAGDHFVLELNRQECEHEYQELRLIHNELRREEEKSDARANRLKSKISDLKNSALQSDMQIEIIWERYLDYIESMSRNVSEIAKNQKLPIPVKWALLKKYHILIASDRSIAEIREKLYDPKLDTLKGLRIKFSSLVKLCCENNEELVDKFTFGLKSFILLQNFDEACKRTQKVDSLQSRVEILTEKENEEKNILEFSKKNRRPKPNDEVGVFHSITRGLFNKGVRAKFVEHQEAESAHSKALIQYRKTALESEKFRAMLAKQKKEIERAGYPSSGAELKEFEEFLRIRHKTFLQENEYAENLCFHYDLFK